MNRFERAAQLWAVLVLAARHRQVLSYDLVAQAIGVPRPAVGGLLWPIQSYCLAHGLPPLTVLVVGDQTGLLGIGFIAAQDIPAAQASVFRHAWLDAHAPSVQELEAAFRANPPEEREAEPGSAADRPAAAAGGTP
jgi:hypothetical protein